MERILTTHIKQELENHKIILIIGQRQVGKTTLLKELLSLPNAHYYDMEDSTLRTLFTTQSVAYLERVLGNKEEKRILLLDEIQYLPEAGSTLKLIHDHFPQTKVFVSGSASFLLLKYSGDSLAGRHITYNMFPLVIRELVGSLSSPYTFGHFTPLIKAPEIQALLPELLVYGALPEIVLTPSKKRKELLLKNYTQSLLFKDIFEIEGIRNPDLFRRLLSLLALQIGQEVSTSELAAQLGISRNTVLEYIALYEKFQILFVLRSFSTNPRKEISKGFKVYFVDLGIRNAVIENYITPELRGDIGGLFENFIVSMFYTNKHYFQLPIKLHFWRNFAGAEVDLVIENTHTGKLTPIEIKWTKIKAPTKAFTSLYPNHAEEGHCISRENFWEYA